MYKLLVEYNDNETVKKDELVLMREYDYSVDRFFYRFVNTTAGTILPEFFYTPNRAFDWLDAMGLAYEAI